MPDDRIYDAINLFKNSGVASGSEEIGGDEAYRERYRQLADDVVDKLWRLWQQEKIRWVHLGANTIGESTSSGDIRVNRRIEPSSDPAVYPEAEEQGKLAATSCNLAHEATHVVRQFEYLEEEVLCRTLQQRYFRELNQGRSYTSRVTHTPLTARFSSSTPFHGTYLGRETRLRSQDLVDNVINIEEYRRDLETPRTAAFIVRSFSWWGGLRNRWPSTRGYYLRSLAAQDQDYAEPILQILESLDRDSWPAARSCAGSFQRVRAGLRLERHGGGAVRLGRTLHYRSRFAGRVEAVQGRLGQDFGVR